MPSKHAALANYVAEDLLADLGPVKVRPMFGGHGFYHGGIFFGLEAGGKIYFKIGESNRADFKAAKSKPFCYDMNGKRMTMSYGSLPDDVLEDHEQAVIWAKKSIQAAKAAKKKK
jgi:DNA transformation protein